jgi:hypothetical protein
MSGLNKLWGSMSDADKATWQTMATQLNISTWNAFVRQNQKDFSNGLGAQRQDPIETSTPPGACTGLSDAVEGRSVTIGYTLPTTGEVFGTQLWIAGTTGFTPAPANTKGINAGEVSGGAQAFVLNGLEPGNYFYRVRSFDYAGDFGTAAAEGSFTISA